jgi:hypothetical protein
MPGSLTGTTVTVNPLTTTIYTLTGANGSCSNTNTVSVTVITTPTVIASVSPTVICAGSTATLTASGATTYTWNPGALSGTNVTVTPTVTTTYTVIGSNGTCTDTKTVSLTVNPNPTVSASASSPSICAGQTATLTGNGATSYTWNPGAITGNTVAVSPTVTTIYTVTGANGSCTNTTTLSLTVNPRPTITATANPTGICAGGSATLSASGGLTYTWSPGSVIGNPVVVNPGATTTYSVRADNIFGCTGGTTLILTVNPSPTVTASASPATICSGGSTTLTASGATTYTWNPGAISGANVVVSPTVNTTYTVTGDNGGCTSTQTVAVSVLSSPAVTAAASKTLICLGDTVTLTGGGAASYTWNPGASTINPLTVTPTASTIYTVTGSNGICSSTATISITMSPSPTIIAISNPTALCSGSSATLSAFGATSYTWSPGSATGSTVVVSPTVSTTYTVTGLGGICTNTQTLSLTVNPTPTVTVTNRKRCRYLYLESWCFNWRNGSSYSYSYYSLYSNRC